MNTLKIEFVQKVKYGNRVYFWVNLITEKETRQACYIRIHNVWCWEEGDSEPEMSNALRAMFHCKGNAILNKVYKTESTITIEA